MRVAERVVTVLRQRGELWEAAPGLVGLRGATRARLQTIDRMIASACRHEAPDEWTVPSALPLATLERASYFASFPQWLTLASHLTDDAAALERIATSPAPARDAATAGAAASAALPPAVCYHVYAALAGTVVHPARFVSAQGCCWRHEGERLATLERAWAFTMREIVCIGSYGACATFRARGIALAQRLARRLGLDCELAAAEDPFFAPTARGRAVLQRLKGLKRELRLPIGDGETVAAASFNLHERFFGEAFDIRLADGSPAFSACVAFGLERWLLAALVATPGLIMSRAATPLREGVSQ